MVGLAAGELAIGELWVRRERIAVAWADLASLLEDRPPSGLLLAGRLSTVAGVVLRASICIYEATLAPLLDCRGLFLSCIVDGLELAIVYHIQV